MDQRNEDETKITGSPEEDKLEYVKPEYFHQVPRRWQGSHGPDDKSTGDDSGNLFMSEPSTSEADSSEQLGDFRSPFASISGSDPDFQPTPPMPPARLLDSTIHSPGNTSLSSWESRHLADRQVHIDFAPRRKGESGHQGGDDQKHDASRIQHQDTGNIKTQQQHVGSINHPNRESGADETNQSKETLTQHLRASSDTTGMRKNTSEPQSLAHLQKLSIPSLSTQGQRTSHADTSVSMVLSASEGESFEGNVFLDNYESSDWFFGDESPSPILANPKPAPQVKTKGDRHRRTRSGSHRRQRSGDTAAVALSTGSTEWKGMEQDNIPLPSELLSYNELIDQDESFEAEGCQGKKNDQKGFISESGSNIAGNSEFRSDAMGADSEVSNFALGQSGQEKASRRPSRRSRRDSRTRKRYNAHEYDDSSNTSRSPQEFQDRAFIAEMQDRAASISNFYNQSGTPVIKRASTYDTSTSSIFSGYYPGSEFNSNRRHSHSVNREFFEQSQRFGRGEGKASPEFPPWWNSPSPILDHRKSFRSTRDYSPHSDPSPESGNLMSGPTRYSSHSPHARHRMSFDSKASPLFPPWWNSPNHINDHRKSFQSTQNYSPHSDPPPETGNLLFGTSGDTPLSRHRKSLDSKWPDALNDDSDLNISDKMREVRFESPMLQPVLSPITSAAKRRAEFANRKSFLPQINVAANEDSHLTFICPSCKTRQREFFTVSSAPRHFETPSGYIALYFAIYVVAALYIFGLQEGWGRLDCFYFAVITLTTAGLGDFVPTSDSAKVMCSIFIYFGVACIGLLLGSYIAGMLDESSSRLARANRIKACPNCTRIQNIKDAAEHRAKEYRKNARAMRRDNNLHQARHFKSEHKPVEPDTKKAKHGHQQLIRRGSDAGPVERPSIFETPKPRSTGRQISPKLGGGTLNGSPPQPGPQADNPEFDADKEVTESPGTKAILGRQSHTRHSSFDIGKGKFAFSLSRIPEASQRSSAHNQSSRPTLNGIGEMRMPSPPVHTSWEPEVSNSYDSDSSFSDSEESSVSEKSNEIGLEEKYSSVKNAKYVFLTLREALVNSMVIIAFGCMGFYFIEGFSIVDSWYFTTVLLTTVGYGDIVPHTKGGKLFATIYILVAGTILLNNMSMISMIPLELRRRRTEMAVLNQFGDSLDDAALRELATGPLIQRLNLATSHHAGLDECTREMFCLAMLVRLGKVTEEDIKLTFAAFRKLDVHDDGVLNSKSIIAGMVQKRKTLSTSYLNLSGLVEQSDDSEDENSGSIPSQPNTPSRLSTAWMYGWGTSFTMKQGGYPSTDQPNGATNEYSSLIAGNQSYGSQTPLPPNPDTKQYSC